MLKRIKSWLYELPYIGQYILNHGWPRLAFYHDGGLGDYVMFSTVLFELHRRGKRGMWVLSDHPDLFRHNPYVSAVVPNNKRMKYLLGRLGVVPQHPYYSRPIVNFEDRDIQPPRGRHILSCLCQTAGICGKITLRPYMYLSESEKKKGHIVANQVAIHSSSLGAQFLIATKQWYPERFQLVVDALKHRVSFVQIGTKKDPLLRGAIDLRDRTSIRETAALLSQSMLFIGLVGFPMHLARAVDCRSVIIYGGRESPEQSGYPCNENLYVDLPCSRCWRYSTSLNDFECMKKITAEEVIAAVERQLERYGKPLETNYDIVPEGPLVFDEQWIPPDKRATLTV